MSEPLSRALPRLPLEINLESKAVAKKTISARAALAELKGVTERVLARNILINTLPLQEARDSSAIENIITTQDDLYRSDAFARQFTTSAAKEVHNYAYALRAGFEDVQTHGLLTNAHILQIQSTLEENNAGFRKLPGTSLKNEDTGEIVYTPPQNHAEIVALMGELETFINDGDLVDWDPLVKMAVIHHQFESIHPFYDGNGRTGRIINILYLVREGLLDTPILYLSRYINRNKADYYSLLQAVRTDGAWEDWLLYMLDGVEQTSRQTIRLVVNIQSLMSAFKRRFRSELPKIYSQDLLNVMFRHPYTKIEFVERELAKHRNTANRYLDEIVRIGLLRKIKIGRENYYLNDALFDLLQNASQL